RACRARTLPGHLVGFREGGLIFSQARERGGVLKAESVAFLEGRHGDGLFPGRSGVGVTLQTGQGIRSSFMNVGHKLPGLCMAGLLSEYAIEGTYGLGIQTECRLVLAVVLFQMTA